MRETRERLESSGREAQVALRAELDSAHQAEVDKLQTKLSAEITQLKTVLQEKEVEIQVCKCSWELSCCEMICCFCHIVYFS